MPEQAEQEAEERAETKAAASRDTSGVPVQSSYTVAQIQAMAAEMVPGSQFECFSNIVEHESSWNYQAANPLRCLRPLPGTGGLRDVLRRRRWRTNPAARIKWGLNHMNSVYDSPCGAWAFWQANRWY